VTRRLPLLLLAALTVAVPFLDLPGYEQRLLNMALVFGLLAVSLNLLLGSAGQISLGHAGFFGIGAYTAALLTAEGSGALFWPGFVAAGVVTGLAGALIGIPTLRLRGHYLALATVGLNVTVEIVTKNWTGLTGGEDGISAIPGITLFAWRIASDRSYYYLALAFLVIATAIGLALRASRFGRAMIAVRDDELAADACGVLVFRTKLIAFALASLYGGLSGVLYAHYAGYISPGDFDSVRSITLLVMLIVGGEASIFGAIGGCVLISFAPEWLRFLGAGYLTVFGIAIMLVLILLPNGAAGALRALYRRRFA
jgi:branched-chain amino acid transport system permease protein